MAKLNPTLYSVAKTFVWFAVVSLILLASLIAIVFQDYDREWKKWQKQFLVLKTQKLAGDLKAAAAAVDQGKLAQLKKDAEASHAAFKAHQVDYEILLRQEQHLDSQIVKLKSEYQNLKQFEDSYRYFYEESRSKNEPKAGIYEAKLKDIRPRVSGAKLKLDALEAQKEARHREIQAFSSKENDLKKEMNKILDEKNRTQKKLENLKPTAAKEILNAPMIDFIAPTLKVQQIVLDNLQDDYHFTKVSKVDRCVTCHLGIDQKGFENAPQPFRTHPNLELYLGSGSPHPTEKFGCTVCHGGNGHSVSFKDSAHMPQNTEQAKEWQKKYRWRMLEKWESKMLPLNHAQAACAKCHRETVEIPKADKLNEGRRLAQAYGCFGCHKVNGFENRWKVGPSLENVRSKLTEDWIVKWLQDPKAFRPSTKMPQAFHLSNTSSPEDRAKNDAAIESIAAYLAENSGAVALSKPPVAGDAARGEGLVKQIGCLGCHSLPGAGGGRLAAELSGLGSKLSEDWLYAWLKDPKHYFKNARMPNLRLTDEEASDITAFLLSQRNDSFEKQTAPEVKPKALDELVLNHLQTNLRREEAEKELSQMTVQEKMQFVGKKSIAHQGCYACHTIKGFEDAKPIGTELSNEGAKDIHQFDFGFVPLDHTRHAWIAQKLKEPRIFDEGKIKDYYEKLRMPKFNLTDEQVESLTTFILSLTEESIPLEMQRKLDLKDKKVEKGRLLAAKFNCSGCHELDGKTGVLREMSEDKGAAPPILDGEGAKVQEKWLHEFLREPKLIRPWLKVHMPTFNFSEEELKDFVEYFAYLAHQEVSYKGYEASWTTPEKLEAGKVLFQKFQCAKCHEINSVSQAMGASFLAPDLVLTKQRLKPDWVKDWMRDPNALQTGTMMPGFFPDGQTPLPDMLDGDAEKQIEAIRDYLYTYEGKQPSEDPEGNAVAK